MTAQVWPKPHAVETSTRVFETTPNWLEVSPGMAKVVSNRFDINPTQVQTVPNFGHSDERIFAEMVGRNFAASSLQGCLACWDRVAAAVALCSVFGLVKYHVAGAVHFAGAWQAGRGLTLALSCPLFPCLTVGVRRTACPGDLSRIGRCLCDCVLATGARSYGPPSARLARKRALCWP